MGKPAAVSAATEHRKLAAIMFTDMVGGSAPAQRHQAAQQRAGLDDAHH
jgi:hypothetical protein